LGKFRDSRPKARFVAGFQYEEPAKSWSRGSGSLQRGIRLGVRWLEFLEDDLAQTATQAENAHSRAAWAFHSISQPELPPAREE
jgi:hypothetical protein